MLSKEQENSKTIVAIFRAIEERDAAQFRSLLQPDLKSIGRYRFHMEGPFAAWSRSLVAGVQLGSLYSRRKWNEKWTLKSLPLAAMMLQFCGTNAGAVPEGTPLMRRFLGSIASSMENCPVRKCSTSILCSLRISWRRHNRPNIERERY